MQSTDFMAISFHFGVTLATGDVLSVPPFGTEVKIPSENFYRFNLKNDN